MGLEQQDHLIMNIKIWSLYNVLFPVSYQKLIYGHIISAPFKMETVILLNMYVWLHIEYTWVDTYLLWNDCLSLSCYLDTYSKMSVKCCVISNCVNIVLYIPPDILQNIRFNNTEDKPAVHIHNLTSGELQLFQDDEACSGQLCLQHHISVILYHLCSCILSHLCIRHNNK